MASLRRHRSWSDRFRPFAGLIVIGNALMAVVNLLIGDYAGAAFSAGCALLLWWLYRV
jgi:hypothetical protein